MAILPNVWRMVVITKSEKVQLGNQYNTTEKDHPVDYEYMYMCIHIKTKNLFRLDWASQTCTLTFETVGLWGEGGGLQTTARYPQVFNFLFSKFLSRSFGAYLYPFLRHENLVAGGDAGGRLRMASVVHGQQVGEHVEDGGEEGGD